MINLGSEYALKVFISGGPQSKDRLDWLIGNLVMPKSIEYKIPEIEDQFYKMPEIYTPEEQKAEGKQNPIYPVAGIVASVLLPWICFIKMVKLFKEMNYFIHIVFSGKIPAPISRFLASFLIIPSHVRFRSLVYR